jgi:hypothetical protein
VPESRQFDRHHPGAGPGRVAARALRTILPMEVVMSHIIAGRSLGAWLIALLEHTFFLVAGFVLMVIGLGLGVTMVLLPVGLVIGLLGVAMFVGGLTVRLNRD